MKKSRLLVLLLLICLLLCLGAVATRLSNNLKNRFELQDDSAAELKKVIPTTDFSRYKVRWRVVVATRAEKSKTNQQLTSPNLEASEEEFLAELARRYPDIQFKSYAAGESQIDERGFCYPQIRYSYFHPEFDALSVSFPMSLYFAASKNLSDAPDSRERLIIVNQRKETSALFFANLSETRQVKSAPLFAPTELVKQKGVCLIEVGQPVLLQTYSCYFEQRGKTLSSIGTHLLFCQLVKQAVP